MRFSVGRNRFQKLGSARHGQPGGALLSKRVGLGRKPDHEGLNWEVGHGGAQLEDRLRKGPTRGLGTGGSSGEGGGSARLANLKARLGQPHGLAKLAN